jgi:transcription initiation factor TFIIB
LLIGFKVLQQHVVDMRSEWRTFSNDDQGNDDPSRVGDAANPLLNGSQLQSSIAFGNGDARARDLNRTQAKANADKGSKALMAAYKQIQTLCSAHHLPKIVADGAMANYKLAEESKKFKGKPQEVLIAANVFIACRQNGVPRSFKEIMNLTKVPKKEIGRTYKQLEHFFKKMEGGAIVQGGMVMAQSAYQNTGSTSAAELCGRFCSQLNLDDWSFVAQDCSKVMMRLGSLAGRSPLSIAAVAIYLISHLMGAPRTAKQIGDVAGVSDGTIRTAYKLVYQDRESIIKPEWIAKGGKIELIPTS